MSVTDPTEPRRRYLPRFSLRTLLILVLLAGSGFGLWWRWEPWVMIATRSLRSRILDFPLLSSDRKLALREGVYENKSPPDAESVLLLDSYTLKDRLEIPVVEEGKALSSALSDASFSVDGRWIILRSRSGLDPQQLVDVQTGAPLLPVLPNDPVFQLKFARDGGSILVWREQGALEVWSLREKKRQCIIDAGPQEVADVALSPDGNLVAVTQKVANPQPMIHPLITTSGNRTRSNVVTLWDANSGTKLDTIEGAYVSEWGPMDEKILAFYEEQKAQKCLYDISAKKVLMDIPSDWILLGTANGERLVFASAERSSLLLCDRWSDQPVLTLRGRMLGDFRYMHFPGIRSYLDGFQSDFGDKIVAVWAEGFPARIGVMPDRPHMDGGGISRVGGLAEKPWNLSVCEWSLKTGKPNWVQVIEMGRYEYPDELEYSSDGGWVKLHFGGSMHGSPCDWVWKNEPGAAVKKLEVRALFSPSGQYLLNRTEENSFWRLYRTGEFEVIHAFRGVSDLNFLDDDTVLASTMGENGYDLSVWQRRRPEGDWGLLWLPEFWFTILFGVGLPWSLMRDIKTLRKTVP